MAIQRMAVRLGQPEVFYSDNGTNLREAHEELKQALANLDLKRLTYYGTSMGSKWYFIPPATPHLGGV